MAACSIVQLGPRPPELMHGSYAQGNCNFFETLAHTRLHTRPFLTVRLPGTTVGKQQVRAFACKLFDIAIFCF